MSSSVTAADGYVILGRPSQRLSYISYQRELRAVEPAFVGLITAMRVMHKSALRLYIAALASAATILLVAAPAHAQYKPRPIDDPATGESYHIEGAVGFWFPTADMTVTSGGSGSLAGITGTSINAERDLGMPADKKLPDFELILRPARAHKFRLNYVPIQYDGSATVTRDIVFNGQRYRLGLPVSSTLDWKSARFAYEFDFISRNRGFGGLIVEAKYTDVQVNLTAAPLINEFARARAPIPALGGIGRVYVVPNISITGEVTGFKLPDSIDSRYGGHYVDVDVYGTVNFTNNIGVKGGYRSLDMGYLVKQDNGSFTLKGMYFAAVLRY